MKKNAGLRRLRCLRTRARRSVLQVLAQPLQGAELGDAHRQLGLRFLGGHLPALLASARSASSLAARPAPSSTSCPRTAVSARFVPTFGFTSRVPPDNPTFPDSPPGCVTTHSPPFAPVSTAPCRG